MDPSQTSYGFSQNTGQLGSPGNNTGSPGRRSDLSQYEGQSPDDWLFRMEKSFLQNQTLEHQKLEVAITCLVSVTALNWLRGVLMRGLFKDCNDFKKKVRK